MTSGDRVVNMAIRKQTTNASDQLLTRFCLAEDY